MTGNARKILFSMSTLKALLFGVLMAALYLWARSYDLSLGAMRDAVSSRSPWTAAAVFIGIYVFVSIAPISARDACKIVGALLFGAFLSALYLWTAEIAAAVLSFHLSRVLGRDLASALAGRRLEWVNRRLEESGLRNMLILRVLPMTPYRYLNFISGLTTVRMRDFLLGTAIGSVPRLLVVQLVFSFFAGAILSGEEGAKRLFWINLGLIAGTAVAVAAVYFLARRMWPGWFETRGGEKEGYRDP